MTCMPSGEAHFCITRGLPVGLVFQFEFSYDLTAVAEARFTVKEYLDEAAIISTTGVIDPIRHMVTVSLLEADTATLLPGRLYWYDLVLTNAEGPVVATCPGRFSVSPTVTTGSAP